MKRLVYIIGAGGLGREIKSMMRAFPEWEVGGFYDDNKPVGSLIEGSPCLGGLELLINSKSSVNAIIALGDPKTKAKIVERLAGLSHIVFPVFVHPSSTLMDPPTILFEAGCIVTPGCILTTRISIGRHTLLNLRVTVGHDTRIGDLCSIMPGANIAGSVQIGNGVLIGSGVNVLNNISVGDFSKIGAGAVVVRDVMPNRTVVGVPAAEKRSP